MKKLIVNTGFMLIYIRFYEIPNEGEEMERKLWMKINKMIDARFEISEFFFYLI